MKDNNLRCPPRPISNIESTTYNLSRLTICTDCLPSLHNYALFALGKTSADCTSTVLRACSSRTSRFSISQRATPAISRSAMASSQLSFACRSRLADRFKEASSSSCNCAVVHSSKNARLGSAMLPSLSPRNVNFVMPFGTVQVAKHVLVS